MRKQTQKAMMLWLKRMSVDVGGLSGMAKLIGMSERTIFTRCQKPETWRLDELQAIRAVCGVSAKEFCEMLVPFM